MLDPFAALAPGQTCNHCGRAFDANTHAFTTLLAVVCLARPVPECRPRWDQHGLMAGDGTVYLSIMEQIGALAGLVEERSLPGGREDALERVRDLVGRLAGRPPEQVRPVAAWFVPEAAP